MSSLFRNRIGWAAARLFTGAFVLGPLAVAGCDHRPVYRSHVHLPKPDHIVVVVEENRSEHAILGSGHAPYLTYLASLGANFTNAHAVTHPSQPNYLALFSGSTQDVESDGRPGYLPFSTPNLAAALLDAGDTFTGYSEDLPRVGFDGDWSPRGPHGALYARKHNPWVNWQDSAHSGGRNALPASVNRPLKDWPADLTKLPTVAFVIPNQIHDMHSASVTDGDRWLKKHLGAYVQWAVRHNSLLIVTWDEDDDTTSDNHIPTLFIGAMIKPGRYDVSINHYNILRTIEDMYGLPAIGESAYAKPITGVYRKASR